MRLRAHGRRAIQRLAEAAAARLGYTLVANEPRSPIPLLKPLSDPDWRYRYPLHGLELDLDAQLAFIDEKLSRYIREFAEEVRDVKFTLWNELYQAGDAETLYALVRFLRPQRILEIGSGNSTVVTSAACEANARDGADTDFVAVDPDPKRRVDSLPGLRRFERVDCRTLPLSRFEELQSGDVLFIDTEHVVKRRSEVNWLVLEALPLVRPGVWVHFHDIFLPNDYPFWLYWGTFPTEQYLLHALLLESSWRVELSLAALFDERRAQLTRLIPSLAEKVPGRPELETWYPSAFWIRRGDKRLPLVTNG
jgi:predicted O-methyltransferase YrrM